MNHFPARTALAALILVFLTAPLFASWEEGVAAYKAGQYGDAAAKFRSVVEQSPEEPAGYYMLGMSLMRQKELSEALQALSKAVELGDDDPRYRLTYGQALVQANRFNDALALFASQDPKALPEASRKPYYQMLAKAATKSTKSDQAMVTLDKAVAGNGGNKDLWLALNHVAKKANRPDKAFAAMASIYDLDKSDGEHALRTVHTAFAAAQKQSDPARRRSWYDKGFEFARRWAGDSDAPQAYLLAGQAKMANRSYDEAIVWFGKAGDADAGDPGPHYYQARCELAREKAPEAALQHAQKGLELLAAPQKPQAALARLEETLQISPDKLEKGLLEAQGKAYRYLEDFNLAARSYTEAGNLQEASLMKELQKAKEINVLYERDKAECKSKISELEKLMEESKDLKGTEVWTDLEQEHKALSDACEDHLKG